MERLDMFFPFEPCLLKKSDRFIQPNFICWSMVGPNYDDDKEYRSNEEAAEVFADGNNKNTTYDGLSRTLEDLDLDNFDSVLYRMSITPKHQIVGALKEPAQMPSRLRPSTSPESL